jgi:adenylate kinase family enzyme
MSELAPTVPVRRRVIVTGLAGAGKSTFSRALGAKTGLPVIHLDLYAWKPGWVRMDDDELGEAQRELLAGEEWIADGNYYTTLAERVARADTVVFLDTPWWICSWRAFMRGIRRPPGFEPPKGCDDSAWQRLRDEWWLVWRIWRVRRSDRERELQILSQHGGHADLHVLRSRREVQSFLDEA